MIGPDFKAIEASNSGFNVRQKLVLVCMDVLLLTELTFCLWLAYQHQDTFAATFLKTYLPLFLPTLAAGVWLARRFRDPVPVCGEKGILDSM